MDKSISGWISMRVVSVAEGQPVGRVRAPILDPAKKRLAGLLIDRGRWRSELRFIPFEQIESVGESIITIERAKHALRLSAISPRTRRLAMRPPRIVGMHVLSRDGRELGLLDSFGIDCQSGEIVWLVLMNSRLARSGRKGVRLEGSELFTIGNGMLVVSNEAADRAEALFPAKAVVRNSMRRRLRLPALRRKLQLPPAASEAEPAAESIPEETAESIEFVGPDAPVQTDAPAPEEAPPAPQKAQFPQLPAGLRLEDLARILSGSIRKAPQEAATGTEAKDGASIKEEDPARAAETKTPTEDEAEMPVEKPARSETETPAKAPAENEAETPDENA